MGKSFGVNSYLQICANLPIFVIICYKKVTSLINLGTHLNTIIEMFLGGVAF
jgi:hypothetical protein